MQITKQQNDNFNKSLLRNGILVQVRNKEIYKIKENYKINDKLQTILINIARDWFVALDDFSDDLRLIGNKDGDIVKIGVLDDNENINWIMMRSS